MLASGLAGPSGCVYSGGWLRTWLLTLFLSWGAMNLIALLVERRTEMLLHPSGQYKAVYFGDSICLPGIAMAVWYLGRHLSRPNLSEKWWWHAAWIILAVAAGILFHVADGRTHFYTHSQFNSPTKLYHDFIVVPGFVYILFSAGLPAVVQSAGGWKPRSIIALLVMAFIALNVYDNNHRPHHGHVDFNWSHFRPGK